MKEPVQKWNSKFHRSEAEQDCLHIEILAITNSDISNRYWKNQSDISNIDYSTEQTVKCGLCKVLYNNKDWNYA